jgi:co-chaperonin GroES (HSP10)
MTTAVHVEAKTKQEMTELVQKMYLATERFLQPLKPFILVRVLPRATVSAGGIHLPEKQNKPNIEAVVLAVYEPYWEKVQTSTRDDGKVEDTSVYNECDIKVGDHIIMPHFVGLPDSFLDDREYRLVKEDDAVAVLHYRRKGALQETIRQLLLNTMECRDGSETTMLNAFAEALLDHFDIVPKVMYSVTTSGK